MYGCFVEMTKYIDYQNLQSDAHAQEHHDIRKILPHRDPFLFLREAVVVSDTIAIGIAKWDMENPIFDGHFPDLKIVPGVCLVEAGAQLVGVLTGHVLRERQDSLDNEETIGVLASIRNCKIQMPVFPNDIVEFRVEINWGLQPFLLAKCTATKLGQKSFFSEFSVSMVNRTRLLKNHVVE